MSNNNTIETLGAVLKRQVASQLAQRFRMTEYKAEEVEQMLMMCYEAEVQKRGVKCEMDDLTKRRVRQAAKWLCGDNFKPSLMLYGRVGSGKSTLARAIVRLIGFLYDRYELGDRRCSVTCCSALDLSLSLIHI